MRYLGMAGVVLLLGTWPCLALAADIPPGPGGVVRLDKEAADPLAATVPALVRALKDPDPQVRTHAASALCSLDRRALSVLIGLLGDKDEALRTEAAKIIGSMGVHGRRHVEALPALTRALNDESVEVRRQASYAISQIVVVGLRQ